MGQRERIGRVGRVSGNTVSFRPNTVLEIVNKFTYLGMVFNTGGSFKETQNTLAGQARKALFLLEKYVYKFTTLTLNQMIDVFDKLILPILNYCSEVWGFILANAVERVHLLFCKTWSYKRYSE